MAPTNEIKVDDGVMVPCTVGWHPAWVEQYGNGKIPLEKMTFIGPGSNTFAGSYVLAEVADRWNELRSAAASAGFDLVNNGAYRTYDEQLSLFKQRYSPTVQKSQPRDQRTWNGRTYYLVPGTGAALAAPGHSNHGWGCAIDMALTPARQPVTGPFVTWCATVAVSLGFSWEDHESWHIHLIETAAGAPPPQPQPAQVPQPSPPSVPEPRLHSGSSGDQVKALQELCTAHQWGNPGNPDGHFGPRTLDAVEQLQHAVGVSADGIYGPQTAQALATYLHQSMTTH